MKLLSYGLLLFGLITQAWAIDNAGIELSDPEHRARYQVLIEELRCVVCQNQAISDSNAELAQDLRDRVREMILSGMTDEEIKTFLVNRYGDFVLYRPPLQKNTYVLWLAPLVIFIVAIISLFFVIRRHRRSTSKAPVLTDAERAKIDKALKQDEQ